MNETIERLAVLETKVSQHKEFHENTQRKVDESTEKLSNKIDGLRKCLTSQREHDELKREVHTIRNRMWAAMAAAVSAIGINLLR
jgi:hypothetical protein